MAIAAIIEIHEQEGKIIEHVDRREFLVELQRIEWHGRTFD